MNTPLEASSNPKEIVLTEDDFIVSKTNSKGRIIYANQNFCSLSGYSENELIGRNHNLVRSEKTPQAIFCLMWEHLKKEEEFFGYIVNKNRNNSYYWTLINTTPFYHKKQLAGYFAVRRAPSSHALEIIKPLYKSMCEIEQQSSSEQLIPMSTAVLWQAITKEYQTYAEFVLSL